MTFQISVERKTYSINCVGAIDYPHGKKNWLLTSYQAKKLVQMKSERKFEKQNFKSLEKI